MKPPIQKRDTDESGFALFVVLSFLLIAAAITTPFLASARIEALVSRNSGQAIRDKVLLQGLLDVAALRYFERYQDTQSKPVRHVDCKFSNLDLAFDFQDHSGLIDLNAAAAEVLAMGFQSLGLDASKATAISNEIVRFRSVYDQASPQGASPPPRNGYKNALFEHVSELSDLLAPAGLSIPNLGNTFTVHSGSGTIDEAAAPDRLLAEIDKRPVIDRYFVVHDTRRTNAVTISVIMQKSGKHKTSAEGIFGRSQNGLGILSLGPVVLETTSHDPQTTTKPNGVQCETFFDATLLQTIREVSS